jgi:hypothetical protein
VIGSVVLAIVTDLFALQLRGRVMGFEQTASPQAKCLASRPVSFSPTIGT